MSFTQTNHVFASVDDQGLNTILRAVFTTRPHYLNYGSAPFVPVTTVNATNMQTIPFPGVPGGIPYQVEFTIPTIDLFPPDPAPSPLPPRPQPVHRKDNRPNHVGLHDLVDHGERDRCGAN